MSAEIVRTCIGCVNDHTSPPVERQLALNFSENQRQTAPFAAKMAEKHGGRCIPFITDDDICILRCTAQDSVGSNNEAEILKQLGTQARKSIDDHLGDKGAVLLRGLPFNGSPEACSVFVDSMNFTRIEYQPLGQLSLRAKAGDLDKATSIPAEVFIGLHNEMAYNPLPNDKIILICLKPADQGGESLLGQSSDVYRHVPQHIKQLFDAKQGVKYTRKYPSADALAAAPETIPPNTQSQPQSQQSPGLASNAPPTQKILNVMSWQERTKCNDRESAAQLWQRLGCNVSWEDDGSLVAWNVQPAVVPHPRSGDMLWFNFAELALAMPETIMFGDGDKIGEEVLAAVVAAKLDVCKAVKLQAGDVLVLDNYKWMHGRLPFEGQDRLIVVVLTQDC